jgi:hypothetical protein
LTSLASIFPGTTKPNNFHRIQQQQQQQQQQQSNMAEKDIETNEGIVPVQSFTNGEILDSVGPFDEKKLLRRIDSL